MATVIFEKDESVSIQKKSVTITHVMQMEGDSLVEIASSSLIPAPGDAHPELKSCNVTEVSVSPNGNLGRKIQALVTVSYKTPEIEGQSGGGNDDTEPEMSFDCSGGTAHIIQSLKQVKLNPKPDPGGRIGWNGKPGQEAEFAGVDVVSCNMRETYTKQMSISRLTTPYKRTLANLTGRVNSAEFKGWAEGEVLFLGASFSGAVSGGDKITVTYNFAIQQNEDKYVEVAPGLKAKKKGWQYIWVVSHTEDDGDVPKVVIDNCYVETIYKSGDFRALKL